MGLAPVGSDESTEASSAAPSPLAGALAALGHDVRLRLLDQLRSPKQLGEIRVLSVVDPRHGAPDRPLSRQAVKEHLERLLDAGVVVAREAERDRRISIEYSLNHQTLFAMSEELRALARHRPEEEPSLATRSTALGDQPILETPCLVLVKGVDEGSVFPIAGVHSGRSWTIGRRRDADIPLDFDPFVSSSHARITWNGKEHLLEDVEENRNGTRLNLRLLPRGMVAPLAHGDLIGVGRSLLLYRAKPRP